MKKKLTKTQKRIWIYLLEFLEDFNERPTLEEIGKRFKMSRQGVAYHIDEMVKKGWLVKDESKKHRKIIIT